MGLNGYSRYFRCLSTTMVSREFLISEIQRIARENCGRAPGMKLFKTETGLGVHAWRGRYWSKWGDALSEAGLSENAFDQSYEDEQVFLAYSKVIRQLGHIPTEPEYILARRKDPEMPSESVLKRLGPKARFLERLLAFAQGREGYSDVAALCLEYKPQSSKVSPSVIPSTNAPDGFVYLIRSGRFHKIGRSNAAGRREREIALQLPEAAKTIHIIRTDDPVGIEAYWHNRFAEKRKNGEWFDLSAPEIAAFKRRKFM